jgi:hypothetical protein
MMRRNRDVNVLRRASDEQVQRCVRIKQLFSEKGQGSCFALCCSPESSASFCRSRSRPDAEATTTSPLLVAAHPAQPAGYLAAQGLLRLRPLPDKADLRERARAARLEAGHQATPAPAEPPGPRIV